MNDSYQIGDAIFLLDHILPPNLNTPESMDACDANDDGTLDIADAISIIWSLFPPNTPLPEPYLVCGADPTHDPPGSSGDLGCDTYPSCP